MNFFVSEMTFLRYFIPLIREGNNRNIQSTVYWSPSRKYNCPLKHFENLKSLAKEFSFNIKRINDKIKNNQITFLIESHGHEYFNGKKISLTYMTDFRSTYNDYIKKIDYCIFPNKMFLEKFNLPDSPKNLFLGSPKYDVNLDKNTILKKYNLPDKKKCLILFPRHRDQRNIDLIRIIEELKNLDFEVCMKARGKEPCPKSISDKVRYFEDESWHPHTSMELISVSDLIINTDSTGTKECVMLRKPVLNFKIKPFENPLNFLCDKKFCAEIKTPINYDLISQKVNDLKNVSANDFEGVINKYLFPLGSSKRILDFFNL
jgi:hypothetical protein